MMRKILFPLFLLTVFAGFGESYDINLGGWLLDNYGNFKKNEFIRIKTVDIDEHNDKYKIIMDKNDTLKLHSSIDRKIAFEINNTDDLWNSAIISRVLPETVMKKGFQIGLRNEIESDALEYIGKVKSNGWDFEDPYLETYIYGLITKIAPQILIDGRISHVNLLLLNDPQMFACMYPNGTMVINTGLISLLKSEEELVAILSREIAHFVLDHSTINVNKEITRKKRETFWAGVATVLTGITEGMAAYETGYYTGLATLSMATATAAISSEVIDYLGLRYTNEQKKEADEYALMTLELLGYPKSALATALNHLSTQVSLGKEPCPYFESYKPKELTERILSLGDPKNKIDHEFEKMISFAITETANTKYAFRKFKQAIKLVDVNIKNKVGVVQDYIIKSQCYLSLYSEESKLKEIFGFLNAAKKIDSSFFEIFKTEIITHLRLGNKQQAIALLREYGEKIKSVSDGHLDFKERESIWVTNMLVKLGAYNTTPAVRNR